MTLRNDGALLLPLALPIALLEERFGTSVDFLWRKVFLMRCQKPDVSERVFQRAATVAIELVLHGLYDLRTCCDRLGKKFVYILDIHVQPNRRATQHLGATETELFARGGHHEVRIADHYCRMSDIAIGLS